MKPMEETTVTDDQLRIMDEIRELINENKLGSRIGCGLLMRIIFEEYKEHTKKEHYFAFLDKCKEYWDRYDEVH